MLLVLNDQQKYHLSLLTRVEVDIAIEFCRVAVEFIKEGTNTKKYHLAAQKLELEPGLIQNAIEAVMHVLTESAKIDISESDFIDSVLSLELPEELNKYLLKCYISNRNVIRKILQNMSMVLPQYKNLEWRFDVKLSSRMLAEQTTPEILLKLHTSDSSSVSKTKILKTDPVNLLHMTSVLEEALKEVKTSHCRRIARNIK